MNQLTSATLLAALAAATIGAQVTTTNLIVTPSSAVFDANNVNGVPLDAAPGHAHGSFASNGSAKTDMYFTPEMLFGRSSVTLGQIASISYWTKKGTLHTADPRDWYLTIYTKPYPGDVSTPTWYGDRIGSEPYFSQNLTEIAGAWNKWTTDGPANKLRFFESTAGAPGANFGTYADPDWTTFVSGNALSGSPYAGHELLSFSIQTASGWAAGFTGQLDGARIQLTDGSVATINFEPFVVATDKDACKNNGWKNLARANGSTFKNQGDCIQYVNTGK